MQLKDPSEENMLSTKCGICVLNDLSGKKFIVSGPRPFLLLLCAPITYVLVLPPFQGQGAGVSLLFGFGENFP